MRRSEVNPIAYCAVLAVLVTLATGASLMAAPVMFVVLLAVLVIGGASLGALMWLVQGGMTSFRRGRLTQPARPSPSPSRRSLRRGFLRLFGGS